MEMQISAALITATGTVISSIIASASAFLIFSHRRNIIELAQSVESYHEVEGKLIEALLIVEQKSNTPEMIKNWRGQYRTRFSTGSRTFVSPSSAKKIRRQYFDFN